MGAKMNNNCVREIQSRTVSSLPFKDTLIKATYHSDYEYVKQLAESKEFDESIIHDIGLLDTPFPLYYLTLCFKICLAHDFRDWVMPFVISLRADIDKLLTFWQEKFGIDPNEKIDYKKYGSHHFYCTMEDETIEDIFYPDSVQMFLDNGCRMIDIQLYDEVCRFHFDKVEELLKAGANPDANLLPVGGDPDDPYNCFDRIRGECSYLCTCEVFPILECERQRWYTNYALQANDIGDILGWAAHEEMYELLKKYYK